jgi:hypothetical protein
LSRWDAGGAEAAGDGFASDPERRTDLGLRFAVGVAAHHFGELALVELRSSRPRRPWQP